MKKSKKILLWSIVPILGASGAIAGVVAATTANSTSIVNTNVVEDSVSGKNSATSNVALDTGASASDTTASSGVATNSTRGSNTSTSTSSATSTSLKISYLSDYVQTFSGEQTNVSIVATGKTTNIKYKWYVNKNDGKGWNLLASAGRGSVQVDAPTTNVVLNWSLYCEVIDYGANESLKSNEVQFTILPSNGRYISVTSQPTTTLNVKGGESVSLNTEAKIVGSLYAGKTIGYQWFKYNSSSGQYDEISGATSSTYSFTANYYETNTSEKYLCRYYFVNGSKKVYLNESKIATVNVEAAEKVKEHIEISSLTATSRSINSGSETTLSVAAKSNLTEKLTYQWYKTNSSGAFELITGATGQSYTYKAETVQSATNVIFMVMIKGQDYYLQSGNLSIRVNPKDQSSIVETPTNDLKIETTVIQNQAPVDSNFVSWAPITGYWYSVNVTSGVSSSDKITYQWYYAGSDGVEHEISGATNSTLTPNTELFKNIYENNKSHRAQLICKVYKNDKLSNVVNQSTNYKFYMTVGVVTRG